MSSLQSSRSRSAKLLSGVVIAALATAVFASAAHAAPEAKGDKSKGHAKVEKRAKAAVTKIRFKLENESVTAGDTVMGSVEVLSGKGRERVALAGAELAVTIDGLDAGSIVTAEDGTASLSVVAEEGEHVVKVFYAGDATHKKAQRAQGYEAMAAVEEVVEPLPEENAGEVPVDTETTEGSVDTTTGGTP